MLKKSVLLLVLVALSLQCKKEEAFVLDTRVCLTAMHHEHVVPSLQYYVKLNDSIFPGLEDVSVYDRSVQADVEGLACMRDLPLGKHLFVAYGYDSLWQEDVIGIMDLELTFSEAIKDTIISVNE